MRICGICDEELKNDDKIVSCVKCNELYHLDCFEDLGGCANPSCENYVQPSLSLAELSRSEYTPSKKILDKPIDIFLSNEESCEFDDDQLYLYTLKDMNDAESYTSSKYQGAVSNGLLKIISIVILAVIFVFSISRILR